MVKKSSSGEEKIKKTPEERYALKLDKIISTLIQMKPISSTSSKLDFTKSKLRECLIYQEEIEKK